MTLNPGDIISSRFRLIEFIGDGGFAEVWKVEDTQLMGNTGRRKYFALKIFTRQSDPARMKDSFQRAYGILQKLKHPHIVRLYRAGEHEGTPYLVLDFCAGGDLFSLLEDRNERGSYFSEQELGTVMGQMAEALKRMHPKIVHSDIKPENILLKEEGHYMLADFGVSEVLGSTRRRSKRIASRNTHAINSDANHRRETIYVTPEYAAPELFTRPPARPHASQDIFSLAVTIYELATGKLPGEPDAEGRYFVPKGGELVLADGGGEIPRIPDHFSDEFDDLIYNSLLVDPTKRFTATEILEELEKMGLYSTSRREPAPDPVDNDKEVWLAAKKRNTIQSYRDYTQQFPDGKYYDKADAAITEILRKKKLRLRLAIAAVGVVLIAAGGIFIPPIVAPEINIPQVEKLPFTVSDTNQVDKFGFPQGTLTATYPEGNVTSYNGGWEHGLWHGEGTIHFQNGDSLQASFKQGKIDPKVTGTYFYSDASRYTGTFHEDLKFNEGVYLSAEGDSVYQGLFEGQKANDTNGQYYLDNKWVAGKWVEGAYQQ